MAAWTRVFLLERLLLRVAGGSCRWAERSWPNRTREKSTPKRGTKQPDCCGPLMRRAEPWSSARRVSMILLIDNYDSFAHNLARYLKRLGQEVRVVRNDA